MLTTAGRPGLPQERQLPSAPRATASLYAYRYAKNLWIPMSAQRLQERYFQSSNHRNAAMLAAVGRYLKANHCPPVAEKPVDIRLLVREDRPGGPVYLCLAKNDVLAFHDTAYALNNDLRKLIRHRLPPGRRHYYVPLREE